jgi:hypothetical protein
MKPTVGRIVHFYNRNGEGPSAAIVTSIDPNTGAPGLFVFPTAISAPSMELEVPFIEDAEVEARAGRGWQWPPQV